MYLALDIDGCPVEMEVDTCATLRQALKANDCAEPKNEPSCEAATCGACTVLLNGAPVLACLTLAGACRGGRVVTAAGLRGAKLNPLRRLFARTDINPCGACASGILVSASSLLAANPRPTRNDVRHALAGHVCRCLGYSSIIDSVIAAGEQPDETFIPHEALPSRDQIVAALSLQQAVDQDNALKNIDPLEALRSRAAEAGALPALDQAAAAFDWPSRRNPPAQSAQRHRPAAAAALVEHAGITSIALVDLEFDAETATVSLRKVVAVVSANPLPSGCAEIAEAAVMDAFFIALRRSEAASASQAVLFPKDFPATIQAPDVTVFTASSVDETQAEPGQIRQAACLATVCAIGSAISRASGCRLPAPPFTPDRLLAPSGRGNSGILDNAHNIS
jgi:aerobic-type carbon monoxide dehydrogenase small subunit (CoxS/CutS family)